jgi:hypothetical protein
MDQRKVAICGPKGAGRGWAGRAVHPVTESRMSGKAKNEQKKDKFTHNFTHWQIVAREVEKADGRTVALLLGSVVENYLERALRFHLGGVRASIDKVFATRPPGVLSTFGAKIDLCEAMGIIGPVTAGNLRRIKDVRNTFAHTLLLEDDQMVLKSVSFESPSVADECQSLLYEEYFPGITQPDPHGAWNQLKARMQNDMRFRFTQVAWQIVTSVCNLCPQNKTLPPHVTPIP